MLILAEALKSKQILKMEGHLFLVATSEYRAGTAKMSGAVHAKLKNLSTGTITERRFHPEERLDVVELERKTMEFLYDEKGDYFFMDPHSFEQVSLPEEVLGEERKFLLPGMQCPIEFYEGNPLKVIFPEFVILKVASTGPRVKETDATMKPAVLENGMEILVPQFIREGEIVKVNVETRHYVERVK